MEQAQTRLRKTFKYPTDDDATSRDDLDEQQQEQLITSLQQSSTSSDILYTRIFTILPLIATIPFFWHFSLTKLLPILLSIASLLLTTHMMACIPPKFTARGGSEAWYMPFQWPDRASQYYNYAAQGSVWAQLMLSLLLCLGSYLTFRFHAGEAGFEHFGLLLFVPGVMFVVVSVVRQSMADVQRGVGELDGLRYGLKGA